MGCATGTCPKAFSRQWQALCESHAGPIGVLLVEKELDRQGDLYGSAGAWIGHGLDYLDQVPAQHGAKTVKHDRLWLVVQGENSASPAEPSPAKLEPPWYSSPARGSTKRTSRESYRGNRDLAQHDARLFARRSVHRGVLLDLVARLDIAGFYEEIERTQNSRHVDAVMAVLTMLRACHGLLKGGRLLQYERLLKDSSHSAVSFAAMAFE